MHPQSRLDLPQGEGRRLDNVDFHGVIAKLLCLPDALRKLAAQDERRLRRGVDDGRNGKRIVHGDQYARV